MGYPCIYDGDSSSSDVNFYNCSGVWYFGLFWFCWCVCLFFLHSSLAWMSACCGGVLELIVYWFLVEAFEVAHCLVVAFSGGHGARKIFMPSLFRPLLYRWCRRQLLLIFWDRHPFVMGWFLVATHIFFPSLFHVLVWFKISFFFFNFEFVQWLFRKRSDRLHPCKFLF